MITKEEIREYIIGQGLCSVGFTHPMPFDRLEKVLKERQQLGYLSGFEKGTVEERCRPETHLGWVRSIIAVALPYTLYYNIQSTGIKGSISGSAVGEDYHRLLGSKLEQAAQYISKRVQGFRYAVMADTGPLVDREIAYRSGIGWYGKNCSIITPISGSRVFLGELLTNLDLEPDNLLEDHCGGCTCCIDNCPTGALTEPYTLDARKCISYLTQQRGVIPRELRAKMETSIYGCDRCLLCCPHNSSGIGSGGLTSVDLMELVNMDRHEFDSRYKQSALGWRGLNVIKRNAVIALGNLGLQEGLNALAAALRHPSPVIRGHSAWAVGRIGGGRARDMLIKSLTHEKDRYVRGEIEAALEELAQN